MQVTKDSIDLGIVVTDEKAALDFYRDGLGLEWEGGPCVLAAVGGGVPSPSVGEGVDDVQSASAFLVGGG